MATRAFLVTYVVKLPTTRLRDNQRQARLADWLLLRITYDMGIFQQLSEHQSDAT
jgi:hypothetical protein